MSTQTNQPILDALAWAYVAAYTPAAERDDYENIVRYREHGGGDLKMDDGDAVAWIRDNVRSLRGLPWPTDKRGIDNLAEAVFDATCRGGDTPYVAAHTILDYLGAHACQLICYECGEGMLPFYSTRDYDHELATYTVWEYGNGSCHACTA